MRQRGMCGEAAEPILSVWVAPEANYCFVEFHTVELTCQALNLSGTMLLNQALRVSRPNNWMPTPDLYAPSVTAAAAAGGLAPASVTSAAPLAEQAASAAATAIAKAASLSGNVHNPSQPLSLFAASAPVSSSSIAAPGQLEALAGTAIKCSNMLTAAELADANERGEVKADVQEECSNYGAVSAVKVNACLLKGGRVLCRTSHDTCRITDPFTHCAISPDTTCSHRAPLRCATDPCYQQSYLRHLCQVCGCTVRSEGSERSPWAQV